MRVDDLRDILIALGITKNDKILVSSDVIKLIIQIVEGDQSKLRDKVTMTHLLDEIIDCFKDIVGNGGTLLFPTFFWGFCKGKTFDYSKTQGQTGSLSNRALSRNDFKRTSHPIYSFAVWGEGADEILDLQNKSSFGYDSPFAWLHKNQGKQFYIDAIGFTFLHYVEEMFGVSYRYLKDFTSEYIDYKGNLSTRTYSMYVRDLNLNFIVSKEGLYRVLLEHNSMKIINLNNIEFGLIPFSSAYDALKDEILNNQSKNLMHWL